MKMMRWILMIGIICGSVLMAGYRLSHSEIEAAAANPVAVPAKASLDVQATTLEEVEARTKQGVVDSPAIVQDNVFGYRLSYPSDWDRVELSVQVISLRSPDGLTQVKIEAAGPLPADGLTAFVDRSLGTKVPLSRQSLTVYGLPAERVLTFSDTLAGQVTTFYIDAGNSILVITGIGQQKAIELIARSLNAPQLVARR